MVLRQYLHYYQNYDVTLDHFLTGLDALGTGRLTFQVLDPDELDRFLSAIRRQLREERSPFELAFNHTYQFYAEPMVMFTNTHDQLLVNVPILLRLATQKPLNLYSIETVPMPFDTNNITGDPLHHFQKMSLCILLAEGVLPLVPIQHYTPRHRAHGYFRRGRKPGFDGSHVGAFCIRHSPPFAIKDHRLSPRLRHAYYKTLLLPTAPGRLAEYNPVRFGSKHN